MPDQLSVAESGDKLFAYAAGELDADSCMGIEAWLASDRALRARLAWYEAVCEGVIDEQPSFPDLPSADEILARMTRSPGTGRIWSLLSGRAFRPLAALATILFVLQAATIAILVGERAEIAGTRSAAPAAEAAIFTIAFRPDSKEEAIRSLLIHAGATIVDGPRQLGEYRVAVPANRADFAESLFMRSGIVEYVRREAR